MSAGVGAGVGAVVGVSVAHTLNILQMAPSQQPLYRKHLMYSGRFSWHPIGTEGKLTTGAAFASTCGVAWTALGLTCVR